MLCATWTVAAQGQTASAQVSTFSIDAPQLGGSKKIWLYLPAEYATSKRKYPVIYMHDAQNLFDAKTSFAGEWNIDEKLDSLKAPVIVVGIENTDHRKDELSPFPHPKHGGGNGNNYLDFLVQTLKPYIDQHYRTKPDSKYTSMMGSSLGGMFTFYALLKYPKVFGKGAVFSPAFWFNRNELVETLNKTRKSNAKIYFLHGDNEGDPDMIPDMNQMENLLNTKRCACMHLNKKVVVKGGQHNEKLWRDGFVKAYLWLD